MNVVSLSRAVACAVLLATTGTGAAAAAQNASIESLLENSSRVTLRQGHVAGQVADQAQLQQYANGDSMLLQGGAGAADGEPILMILCGQSVYFNMVGGLPDAVNMQGDALKAARMGQYMALLGGVAMVQGTAGKALVLPEPGARLDTAAETSWAYGKERFALEVERPDPQRLRILMTKLATLTTTPASAPDDAFSTDDDRAARLAELEPVGAWRELLISTAARQAQVPGQMTLQGWEANEGATATTVERARNGCSPR